MSSAWFVDGGYANKAWQAVAGYHRMDYAMLRAEIEKDAGEAIGDAYYFNCDNDPPSAGQNAFHRFLSSVPPRGAGLRVKLATLARKRLGEEHWIQGRIMLGHVQPTTSDIYAVSDPAHLGRALAVTAALIDEIESLAPSAFYRTFTAPAKGPG